MNTDTKTLAKRIPAWHAEAAELLKQNFSSIHSSFLNSTKKAVWLGLFLNEIKRRGKKDKSIPHGGFGPWIKQNLPDIHWDTVCTYMRLGREVCEKGKFQISDFPEFANGELPPQALKLIEGKTQNQLFLEFKQVDEDDPSRAKRGRLKGSSGLTREMRLKAKFASEHERLIALQTEADLIAPWLLENCNLNSFARMDELPGGAKSLARFADAVSQTHLFLTSLKKAVK
jgi:hypothetical protein